MGRRGSRPPWPCVPALALFLAWAPLTSGQTADASRGARLVVDAAVGDTVAVQAWKTGGAWTLRVRDPSGAEVASVVWRRPAVVTLPWSAARSGRHIVECEPTAESGATCELEVIGSASAGDPSQRVAVEASLRRGYELLGAWSADARRRAEREFKEAHETARALGWPDAQVDALLGLATAQQLAGEVEKSLASLETAVARAAEAGDRRRFVLASAGLGSSLATLGQGDRARRHLDEALRAATEAGFPLGAAEAHLGLGDVHYLRSELLEARREYQTALEAFQRLGNAEGLVEAHLDVGYTFADLSQHAHARSHFERALELARATEDRRREATALRVLGNVHSQMSDEEESIRYFEAARVLFAQAEDQVALVGLYNGLAEVHGRLNDLPTAIQYNQMAETLARSAGYRTGEALALLNIATYQRRRGRLDAAADSYGKARALFDSIGDTAMAAAALAGLGNVAAAEGRHDDAVRHLQAALGIMRKEGEARLSSGMLGDLAETYLSMGRPGLARESAEEALSLARQAVDSVREARALFLLARAARNERAFDEAKQYAEQALAAGESLRTRVPSHELRALSFEELEPRYAFYVDLLMEMERARPEEPFERLAFEASERARARVLLDRLQGEPASPESGDEVSLARESALREQIRAQALREDLGIQKGPEGEARLAELLAELRRVEGLGRPGAASPAGTGLGEARGLEAIRASLAGEGTLVVEYSLGAERSYLWCVSGDRLTVHVLPSRLALEDQARQVYGLLTARQREAEGSSAERRARTEAEDARFREAGSVLARTLLGPIGDLDAFKRLIVVSDGMLNYVPFSALPHPRAVDTGDYRPLVLTHEIVRAPSLSVMVAMRERSGRRGAGAEASGHDRRMRLAVFADPVFTRDDPRVHRQGGPAPSGADLVFRPASLRGSGRNLATLPRLLASREEAASIAKAAPGAEVTIATDFRVDRAAAEEALADAYRVVHFATHGILNDEHPELSGIVTSLVDETGRVQDGFLRAQDVYALRVTADLVVLSACETALGKVVRGEGITGLVHAFLHAGAQSVVASKWRVEDAATQELMAEFYRRMLAEGASPASALRGAQISLFQRRRTRAPFFWAAFEVHGLGY
jgi:CHAT domain-containing protein